MQACSFTQSLSEYFFRLCEIMKNNKGFCKTFMIDVCTKERKNCYQAPRLRRQLCKLGL